MYKQKNFICVSLPKNDLFFVAKNSQGNIQTHTIQHVQRTTKTIHI